MKNKYTVLLGCLGCLVFLFMSCLSLNIDTAAHELEHREKVSLMSFCTAENKLAAVSRDGFITIWDLNNGNKIREINTNRTDAINSMVYTNFGYIIVRYKKDNKNILVYNSDRFIDSINLGSYNNIEQLTCSPDGRSIIFSTVVVSRDRGTTTVKTTKKSSSGATISSSEEKVETSITSYSRELHARAMAPNSMSFVITLPKSSETSISFFADDKYKNIPSWGKDNRLTSISIDQVNNRIACGFSDGYIRIYSIENKRLIRAFSVGHGVITDLSFSPDGKYLLIGADRFVSLWNCGTWSKVGERKVGIIKSLEYSPDGRRFIVKVSGAFIIFNSQNARELNRVKSGNLIQLVTFNNDNDIIAIGNKGRAVIVWDNIENDAKGHHLKE